MKSKYLLPPPVKTVVLHLSLEEAVSLAMFLADHGRELFDPPIDHALVNDVRKKLDEGIEEVDSDVAEALSHREVEV